MPIKTDKSQFRNNKGVVDKNNMDKKFRPPQEYLSLFWTMAEGTDQKRMDAATGLVKLIQRLNESPEKEKITNYCLNRLVGGLGSGRKFARVGYSAALTLLLRQLGNIKTSQVFTSIRKSLKADGHSVSKSEKAGVYLGRAFAFSCLIQAGRASQCDGDLMSSMVDEILSISGKRSYLKPVCSRTLENLISQVTLEAFGKHIWPKIRDKLTLGWDDCTLDRLTLLLIVKDTFPDIVNKKFIKKHWGFPIFSEENDEKFVQTILNSHEKSDVVTEKILPFILSSGRDVYSVWSSFGEKLYGTWNDKKQNVASLRQLLAVSVLSKLISLTTDADQITSLILIPSVMKCIFNEARDHDPYSKAIDHVVKMLCDKLKLLDVNVLEIVQQTFAQEGAAATGSGSQEGRLRFVHSVNFSKIVNSLNQAQAKEYIGVLIGIVKGQDEWKFLSKSMSKKERQLDWCLRQLQLVVCSQTQTSLEVQKLVLTLFLRFGFFKCHGKAEDIEHCETESGFSKDSIAKQLCESFFFKSLDHLSTLNTDQNKKGDHLSHYLELLSYLAHYLQSLVSSKKLTAMSSWSNEMSDLWSNTFQHIEALSKVKMSTEKSKEMAFLLLYSYLGFNMLNDFKTSSEILQDVFECEERSMVSKKKDTDDEPQWTEVLTEILLQLLSLQSHLARVVSSLIFKHIMPHLNADAVQIVVQTLIPKKSNQDDTGGILVENDDADEDENGKEESSDDDDLLDEDVADEDDDGEEEDSGDDDDDDDDVEEENMEVDENFRVSVQQALGNAGISKEEKEEEEEDDLPDLSDSEMFALDEALAEVFRQRKKSKGKKAREEKKKELKNFRLRVLDLVEVMIKSERCGYFLLDLLRPLLLLILTSHGIEEESTRDRATSLFNLSKSRSKGLTDDGHGIEAQLGIFQELVDLAKTVNDASQLPFIATACSIVIKISTADYSEILRQTLANVLNKRQSKPLPVFFTTLFESETMSFQFLTPILLNCLCNKEAKMHSRTLSCSLLASLSKKHGNSTTNSSKIKWMQQAASHISQEFESVQKEDLKVMFLKELMTLALALLTRTDVLSYSDFGESMKCKLMEVKSKMNTDSKRLANKTIAALDRLKNQSKMLDDDEQPRKQKKTKTGNVEMEAVAEPKKKKRKTENNTS